MDKPAGFGALGALGLIPLMLDRMGQGLLAQVPIGVTAAQLAAAIAAQAAAGAAQLAAAIAALPSAAPVPAIANTANFGLVGTMQVWPTNPKALSAGSVSDAWKVYAPAGSTWQLRAAVDPAVPPGEVLTIGEQYSATVNGVFGGIAANFTIINSNGTASILGPVITVPGAGYLTYRLSYTNVAGLASQTYSQLVRLT